MTDILIILGGVVVGFCSAVVLHVGDALFGSGSAFYGRSERLRRRLAWRACIGLAVGGGLLGCGVILGVSLHGNSLPPHQYTALLMFLSWLLVVAVYLIFNVHTARARAKEKHNGPTRSPKGRT
jgi:hypothetical protein